MNVNNNVMTYTTSIKVEAPKQPNKSEEFKKVLDNQEMNSVNSSNENAQKKHELDDNDHKVNSGNLDKPINENQKDNVESTTVEGNIPKDLNNANSEVKAKIINIIEVAIDKLKQTVEGSSKEMEAADKSKSQMDELQQLLQLLSSMLQNIPKVSATIQPESKLNSTELESLVGVEKLNPDAKSILKNSLGETVVLKDQSKGLMSEEQLIPDAKSRVKNNLSEIVGLLEKSKSDNVIPSQIIDVLQKLTNVVEDLKGDLSLFKSPSLQTLNGNSEDKLVNDNLLKKVIELSTKTTAEVLPKSQMQSSNDSGKGSAFSENSSSEENFLKNLLSGDKDEIKISKAVNFMNQFEAIKTVDTAKVQAVNLVIDKSDFTVDVIKNIKFMEVNNIKDLTVKMNPKELGEITIKLTMESGIMKASISAQNKDTYNLLNQNIQDISDRLKNMDIKIQSLDINIYEDSTFFNKGSNEKNNNEQKNNNGGTNKVLEEDISISDNYAIEENQVNKFV